MAAGPGSGSSSLRLSCLSPRGESQRRPTGSATTDGPFRCPENSRGGFVLVTCFQQRPLAPSVRLCLTVSLRWVVPRAALPTVAKHPRRTQGSSVLPMPQVSAARWFAEPVLLDGPEAQVILSSLRSRLRPARTSRAGSWAVTPASGVSYPLLLMWHV
jgi:hypothetical protein